MKYLALIGINHHHSALVACPNDVDIQSWNQYHVVLMNFETQAIQIVMGQYWKDCKLKSQNV